MAVRFARQVSAVRRISLPKRLAAAASIPERGFVRVMSAPPPTAGLLLVPVDKEEGWPVRAAERPRQLNVARQVTLPVSLMEQVRIKRDDWVYLSRHVASPGVLVEPAGVEP